MRARVMRHLILRESIARRRNDRRRYLEGEIGSRQQTNDGLSAGKLYMDERHIFDWRLFLLSASKSAHCNLHDS